MGSQENTQEDGKYFQNKNNSSYIPKLPALLSANYKPTAEDILHLRIPTTSVNEINFAFSNRTIRSAITARRQSICALSNPNKGKTLTKEILSLLFEQ